MHRAGREGKGHQQSASAPSGATSRAQSLGSALCGIPLAGNALSPAVLVLARAGWHGDGARLLQHSAWHGSARGQTLSRGCQPGPHLCNTLKADSGPAELRWMILAEERPHPAGSLQGWPSQCPAAPGVAQHGGQRAPARLWPWVRCTGSSGSCLQPAPRCFPGKMEPLCPGPSPFPGKGSENAPAGHRQTRRELFRWGLGFWEHLPRSGPSTMAACLPQSRQLSSAAN